MTGKEPVDLIAKLLTTGFLVKLQMMVLESLVESDRPRLGDVLPGKLDQIEKKEPVDLGGVVRPRNIQVSIDRICKQTLIRTVHALILRIEALYRKRLWT